MKSLRVALIFLSLAITVCLTAQNVTEYGVIKVARVTQASTSDPVASAQPFSMTAYVAGTGLASTYTFTPPGGSAHGFNSSLLFNEDFTSLSALNAAYPNGVYSMSLPRNSGAGPQTAILPALTGDAYPVVPKILSGTWAGNRLQIDPTQNYTLTAAPFTGFSTDDSIGITIKDARSNTVHSEIVNTARTTFAIGAGTLAAGQTYTVDLSFNHNVINHGVPITGANGNAGYTTTNVFQIATPPLAIAAVGLANMSIRAVVAAGSPVIPGIVLDAATRVLIRVAGPGLAAFGVTGTLPNPRLAVMSGNTVIATNDDWSSTATNQAAVTEAGAKTGAFAFAIGSRDAALVLDLNAGNYTCAIAGDAGTTGEIILEIYRVPQ